MTRLPIYRALVKAARPRFVVLRGASWDRTLFLNLTFWTDAEVVSSRRVPPDAVAHAAWHAAAHRALRSRRGGAVGQEAILLGEAIASAFDLYLVGQLLRRRGRSPFLDDKVPQMAEAAQAAGLSGRAFERLLHGAAADPDATFEAVRQLLFDATTALLGARDVTRAARILARFDGHAWAPILHHFELSTWILFARAYGRPGKDRRARAVDRALRKAPSSLAWLAAEWLGVRAYHPS